MKLLTLLRHAKSDWSTDAEADFDRPLKDRGRRDAPQMGDYFARLALVPDLIVSSPAKRARQTAELFAVAAGYRKEIQWAEEAYMASSGELISIVRDLPDSAGHVLLIGHNPGLENLAAQLIGADAYGMAVGIRLPTSAAAHIVLSADVWREVQTNTGQLQWLVNPKLLEKVGK
jgi:phosphohistidine phosphatase